MKRNIIIIAVILILSIATTSCWLLPDTTFTITFDENSGYGTMEDQTFQGDGSVTLEMNTFSHQVNTFVSWNTMANGTGISYTDGQTITPGPVDLTLYAIWSENLTNNGHLIYHSFTTDNVIDLRDGEIAFGHFITIDFVNGAILFDQSADETLVQFYQEDNHVEVFGYLRLYLSDNVKSIEAASGELQHIAGNTMIDATTSWVGNNGIGDISGFNNWGDESNVFIPIKMKINSSAIYYYGYIEVSFVDDPGLLTIHSIAYRDDGSSLVAGEQPE